MSFCVAIAHLTANSRASKKKEHTQHFPIHLQIYWARSLHSALTWFSWRLHIEIELRRCNDITIGNHIMIVIIWCVYIVIVVVSVPSLFPPTHRARQSHIWLSVCLCVCVCVWVWCPYRRERKIYFKKKDVLLLFQFLFSCLASFVFSVLLLFSFVHSFFIALNSIPFCASACVL